jgi:hypothetical protein
MTRRLEPHERTGMSCLVRPGAPVLLVRIVAGAPRGANATGTNVILLDRR